MLTNSPPMIYQSAGAPPRSLSGFGLDYEEPIGRAAAMKLLRPGQALPRMGYEIDLCRIREDSYGGLLGLLTGALTLQNISGTLVLASHTHPRERWPEVFLLQDKQWLPAPSETATGPNQ